MLCAIGDSGHSGGGGFGANNLLKCIATILPRSSRACDVIIACGVKYLAFISVCGRYNFLRCDRLVLRNDLQP